MSAHRLLHVVKEHEGLTRQPSWRGRAEVGQPTVIGHVASVGEHGVGGVSGILELIGLERNPVREQHFCDHALGFKILEAHGRVPLPLDGQLGLAIPGVWSARRLHRAYPIVVGLEVLRLDVVAVDRSRSPNVPIDRNDCRASHWNPSRRLDVTKRPHSQSRNITLGKQEARSRPSRSGSFGSVGSQLRDESIDIGVNGPSQVDPGRIGQPLDLEAHHDGDDLLGNLVDVDIPAHLALRYFSLKDPSDEIPRHFVSLHEEVMQRVAGIEAFRTEHDVQAGEGGRLHVVLTQLPKAGERQINGKCTSGAEGIGLVTLRHYFTQQSLLGAEVVQEPRSRHSHPIGERGDAGSPIPLGGKQVDSCVDDLLSTKISSRLGIAFVGPSSSAKMSASGAPGTLHFRSTLW